jgi:hypothetical protein
VRLPVVVSAEEDQPCPIMLLFTDSRQSLSPVTPATAATSPS